MTNQGEWDPAWGDPDAPADPEFEKRLRAQAAGAKRTEKEDRRRREYPTNLVLLGVIFLLLVAPDLGYDGEISPLGWVSALLGVGLVVAGAIVAGVRRG